MSAPSLARISGTPSDGDPKTTSGRREDFHRRVRSVRTSRTTLPLREVEIVKSCLLLPMSLSSVRLIRVTLNPQYIGNRVGSTSSPLSRGDIRAILIVTLSLSLSFEGT